MTNTSKNATLALRITTEMEDTQVKSQGENFGLLKMMLRHGLAFLDGRRFTYEGFAPMNLVEK